MSVKGRILVTGASGQVGLALTAALCDAFGAALVIAADNRPPPAVPGCREQTFVSLDVADGAALRRTVELFDIGTVYHLAAVKAAEAERRRAASWNTNVNGLYNALEAMRSRRGSLFFASSIAAASDLTLYGVSKRAGELLCGYYRSAHGVDARSLRLPALLQPASEPGGGGTADFVVEMLSQARRGRPYRCYLSPQTSLPFLHLRDAVPAIRALMETDARLLRRPIGASVPGFSLTPERLERQIRRRVPGFRVNYEPDPVRQAIADSWPDRVARSDSPGGWSFKPRCGREEAVAELLGCKPRGAPLKKRPAYNRPSCPTIPRR